MTGTRQSPLCPTLRHSATNPIVSFQPIYRSAEQRAVWRILCGDLERLGRVSRDRARLRSQQVLGWFRLLKEGFNSVEFKYSASHQLHSYTTYMGNMFKRRPFLSIQGYVGLAPAHALSGDVIIIIYYLLADSTCRHTYKLAVRYSETSCEIAVEIDLSNAGKTQV